MVSFDRILIDGLMLSAAFSVFVVSSLLINFRLWIQDLPPDIRSMVPPKTAEEKRKTVWLAIPLFVLVIGGPVVSIVMTQASDFNYSYPAAWLHAYLLWQVVNVWDLVVIDWIGSLFVNPAKPPIPGTEGAKGYRDYRFHFVGFLKGSAMGIATSALSAGIAILLLD